MNVGKPVTVWSQGRQASVPSPRAAEDLYDLEVTGQNYVLPQESWDLLHYWQQHGGYPHAYEVLQSIRADQVHGVTSHGRQAPVSSFPDLKDLASFEDTWPTSDVPQDVKQTLVAFQKSAESAGHIGFRVGNREGRAYEGWRALRTDVAFDVWGQGTWNTVTDRTDLQELDALLGKAANDILPADRAAHHLGPRNPHRHGRRRKHPYGILHRRAGEYPAHRGRGPRPKRNRQRQQPDLGRRKPEA